MRKGEWARGTIQEFFFEGLRWSFIVDAPRLHQNFPAKESRGQLFSPVLLIGCPSETLNGSDQRSLAASSSHATV